MSVHFCPSGVTKKWLLEATKLLRKNIVLSPDCDVFVEFLIRALVAQAALETSSPDHLHHMETLKEREEWSEILAALGSLEDSSQNPAVARLRFHVAWDLDGLFPEMFWVEEGLKWLQCDPAADFQLAFIPVISNLFEALATPEPAAQARTLSALLPVVLDRIETGCNADSVSLWSDLARSLKIFR